MIKIRIKHVVPILIFPILIFIIELFFNITLCFQRYDTRNFAYYKWKLCNRHIYTTQNTLAPLWTNFVRSSVTTMIQNAINELSLSSNLSESDIKNIERIISDHKHSETLNKENTGNKIENIIFIIVESYLSVSSDMHAGGVEITPYLNSLKRDSNVYYNGNMHSNIGIGESSDGQFIYMTGLLPLRNSITIGNAGNITLPGLPKLLKRKFINMEARMIIPTSPTVWNQKEACIAYGFDKLYSANDYHDGVYETLSDENVFDLAMQIDKKKTKNFFSVILTMSMHSPYYKAINTDKIIHNNSQPERYNNYLTACHYTDKQIGKYLEYLKNTGIYNKSLIIISADHHIRPDLFDMEGRVSEDIPLYIINGNIDRIKKCQKLCNQLDVYTTILDILDIKSKWRGLGNTLLNCDYTNSVDEEKIELSEKIIRGNFFNNRNDMY